MSATPRDLAALEPWQASLERSRTRRVQMRKPSTPKAATTDSAAHHMRGLANEAHTSKFGRDLAEAEPWELSLGRSRARRRAAQLSFVPANTRVRRLSLGALVALTAAPTASLGDASISAASASTRLKPVTQLQKVQEELGGPLATAAAVKRLRRANGRTDITPPADARDRVRAVAASYAGGATAHRLTASYAGGATAHGLIVSTRHTVPGSSAEHPERMRTLPPQGSASDLDNGGTQAGIANAGKNKPASRTNGIGKLAATTQPHSHQSPADHPVRALQAALHVAVDGDFGPETEAAIRRFQAEHGLAVTGVVSRETWAALGFHGMKVLKPPRTALQRLAKVSDTETGGTRAGRAHADGARTPAASTRPSARQRPAAHPAPTPHAEGAPTPHAEGAPTPHAEGYVNPLPGGFTAGRTDMGVDFSATPGMPILAIGDAKILGIYPNWYPPGGPNGGNFLEYELLSGPDAGRKVYVAEQIEIAVHAGETVNAGATVGRYAASGTGIETGWAAGGGVTLAQATTGYQEGQETEAGSSFRSFLRSLGANV